MDGLADAKDNKWSWGSSNGVISANFTMGAEATINAIKIITLDEQRFTRHVKTFEVLVEMGGHVRVCMRKHGLITLAVLIALATLAALAALAAFLPAG